MLANDLSQEGQVSSVMAVARASSVVVEIGGLPIRLHCNDQAFLLQIHERYAGYVSSSDNVSFDFDIELAPPGTETGDEDLSVTCNSGIWLLERGDFRSILFCALFIRCYLPGRVASSCMLRARFAMAEPFYFQAFRARAKQPWRDWRLRMPRC